MSDRDRTAVNQRPERASYRPRLTVYGCPAYTGEPHPWYFDSGWDTLGVMSQDHGDSGD